MVGVDEFVQIEDIDELRGQIRKMNYKLLNAINDTNILRELEKEKKEAIKRAAEISKAILPEVKLLNAFLLNEDDTQQPAAKRRKRGRLKKPEVEALKESLRAIKRKRGRTRKRR